MLTPRNLCYQKNIPDKQKNNENITTLNEMNGDLFLLLTAATKLGQGNIFTGICLSTGGEGCLPQCMLGYTPLDQTPTPPPGADPPRSRPPLPLGVDTPPRADTPSPPRE